MQVRQPAEARATADRTPIDPRRDPSAWVAIDPECEAAARGTAKLLAAAGHEVVELTPPWRDERAAALLPLVWVVEIGAQLIAGFGREDILLAITASLEEHFLMPNPAEEAVAR